MKKPEAGVPPIGGDGPATDPTVKVYLPSSNPAHTGQDGRPEPAEPVEPSPRASATSGAEANLRTRAVALGGAAAVLAAGMVAIGVLGTSSGTHPAHRGSPTLAAGTAPGAGAGAPPGPPLPGVGAGPATSPQPESPSAVAGSMQINSPGGPATIGGAAATALQQTTASRAAVPAYAGRLASRATSSATTATTAAIPLSRGSSEGDALVLSVMLTNTHSGPVSARDNAGNAYAVVVDQSDLAGDRTLILVATDAKALAGGGSVTITFPATQEEHAALDAFSGVHKVAGSSSHEAKPPGDYASGYAALPETGGVAFEAAGLQGGAPAVWSGAVTALPTLVVAPSDQLATAYAIAGGPGEYQAAGTCTHQWMAAVVTLS